MQNIFEEIILPTPFTSAICFVSMLIFAPFFTGMLNKFRAKLEFREGPSVFQAYYDLRKLLSKELIIPETSSWIFRFFPYLVLSLTISLVFFLPTFFSKSDLWYFSDLIFIFGIFALISFFMVLASFDAGTSFVGMGSSREAFLVSLTEPVLMLIVLALSLEFKTSNLFSITKQTSNGFEFISHPVLFFLAVAFLIVMLVENKRFPFDNASTHLELTMVHEALVLEYSGKYLAMLEYASMLKLTIFANLFSALFFSFGISDCSCLSQLCLALLVWFIKLLIIAFFLALFEKSTAKLRLFKIPELMSFAVVLSLIAVFGHYFIQSSW
jgi:formate hydrogenlyase subunit 4